MSTIDPLVLRGVLSHYPTGVVLVTGTHPDGTDLAFVVGTFLSVSLEPPLVAFLAMQGSASFAQLQQCPSMCVNILGAQQEPAARAIASRRTDKLDGLDVQRSPAGNPVLADSVAWIDVEITDVTPVGDHFLVMCSVLDLAVLQESAPLLFSQGGYGRFTPLWPSAHPEPAHPEQDSGSP